MTTVRWCVLVVTLWLVMVMLVLVMVMGLLVMVVVMVVIVMVVAMIVAMIVVVVMVVVMMVVVVVVRVARCCRLARILVAVPTAATAIVVVVVVVVGSSGVDAGVTTVSNGRNTTPWGRQVGLAVLLQVRTLRKRLLANHAEKWFLTTVGTAVVDQVVLLAEPFGALTASVRADSGVDARMSSQMSTLTK